MRRLVALAGLLMWAVNAAGQVGPRIPRTGLPTTPVYSKDGSLVVYAPASKAGYRSPVLVFVERTREDLKAATRLKLGSQACLLEVAIGGKSDGDASVLTARLRDPDGGMRERIELPDPEAADLAAFRKAICIALLRAWMVDNGGTDATMKDLPMWLINGLLRYMDRTTRQADTDRMLLLWSRACLPPAAELFAKDSLAATREAAVAAVLASWFTEKREGYNTLEALLRGAATGKEWSPEVASLLLAGTNDMAAFDAYVDTCLMAESRVVIKPGLTSAGIMRRFRSHLLLYAPYFGKNLGQSGAWCTFQEAAAHSDDPAVRRCAAEQVGRVKMAALGRDGMLLAVSEAYAAFLEALAKGEKQGDLTRLLVEAERMRGELERRTAQGEVLQRKMD